MKHKVFVLNFARGWNPTETEIETIDNIEELNSLLDKGWTITDTIQLGEYGNIQSIVYNLRMVEPSKSYQA